MATPQRALPTTSRPVLPLPIGEERTRLLDAINTYSDASIDYSRDLWRSSPNFDRSLRAKRAAHHVVLGLVIWGEDRVVPIESLAPDLALDLSGAAPLQALPAATSEVIRVHTATQRSAAAGEEVRNSDPGLVGGCAEGDPRGLEGVSA